MSSNTIPVPFAAVTISCCHYFSRDVPNTSKAAAHAKTNIDVSFGFMIFSFTGY